MFVGFAISVAVFIPLERSAVRTSWDLGVKSGVIDGKFLAADALEKEFGRYDGKTQYSFLFSVKTTDVISIETNGVRTVRVIP